MPGEGGMIQGKNEELIARAKILALHGMSKDAWQRFSDEGYKHYQVVAAGFKYNMMDLQAAIGIHQLARVEKNWKKRELVWQRYMEALAGLPIGIPAPVEFNTRHAYHLFTIDINEQVAGISRDAFLNRMTQMGVGAGVHYLSVPEYPYYQETFGWRPEDYPNAMKIGRETISIPLSPKLTLKDTDKIINAINTILLKHE